MFLWWNYIGSCIFSINATKGAIFFFVFYFCALFFYFSLSHSLTLGKGLRLNLIHVMRNHSCLDIITKSQTATSSVVSTEGFLSNTSSLLAPKTYWSLPKLAPLWHACYYISQRDIAVPYPWELSQSVEFLCFFFLCHVSRPRSLSHVFSVSVCGTCCCPCLVCHMSMGHDFSSIAHLNNVVCVTWQSNKYNTPSPARKDFIKV